MKVKASPVTQEKAKLRSEKAIRNRIKYTDVQLACLEKVFCHTQYPDTYTMEEMAKTLNINGERLSIWFQNRRSKFKRQSKDGYVSWMRNQLYQTPHAQPIDIKTETEHVLSAPTQTARTEPVVRRPSSNLHYMPPVYRPYDIPSYAHQSSLASVPPASCRYQLSQAAVFTSPLMTTSQPIQTQLPYILQRNPAIPGLLNIPSPINRHISEMSAPMSARSSPPQHSPPVVACQTQASPEHSSRATKNSFCTSAVDFPCTSSTSIESSHLSIHCSPVSITNSETSSQDSPDVVFDLSSELSSASPAEGLVLNEEYYRQQTTEGGLANFTYQCAQYSNSQRFGCNPLGC